MSRDECAAASERRECASASPHEAHEWMWDGGRMWCEGKPSAAQIPDDCCPVCTKDLESDGWCFECRTYPRKETAARSCRWLAFYGWKVWNRTRYYWPQAQSRKRAVENLRRDAHALGFAYVVNVPWWWPFGGTGRFVDLREGDADAR